MSFLGFSLVYGMRINLSVALVDMVSNKTVHRHNTTVHMKEFDWDTTKQGVILGSFFMGYMITQIPGGWIAGYAGGTRTFGIGLLFTSIFTLFTAPAARLDFLALIAIRIMEGIAEGFSYPAMHAIWSVWAPSLEKSKLTTISMSGAYFGTVIGLPLAGELTKRLSWSSVFYFYGVIGIVWYIVWFAIIYDQPCNHPTITPKELEYLRKTTPLGGGSVSPKSPPWKSILASPPFWAILVAHFCENWGFYTFLTTLPTYFSRVIGMDIEKTGFLSALPYLCLSITCQLGGQLADYWRSRNTFTTTTVRKLFNTIACFGQAIFLIITAQMKSKAAAVACVTIAVGFSGFGKSGYLVNHLDLSPKYASLLLGMTNFCASIPGIVSPILVGYLTTEEKPEQWTMVFYISSALYILGGAVYFFFASGEKQPWADGYECTKF
ncbi:expressed hypothetical protein [Trichoplax adhaerens]|uniref:Sialin n=1 Tax=Trichoplax adhaerens TaxID=10228 RepID=B3RY79_TRIAD|nr:expressed hypothetical protein [Trichoplax adhaerens]EDV24988.1 expressed hypothetical protein [Trichoplax adhaerens]|eukprot:XP_002112878.1 expressed hypothetical protein [Trichoplax adhaerens]